MICGHVKDFKVKMSMEETCKSCLFEQDTHKKGGDASMIPEGERKNFPLDLLQCHHPCEPLQLHSSIKQKFTKVFQTFFHPIPSLPDFFFFFSEQQVHQVEYNDVVGGINEQSDDNENAEKSETETDSQMELVPDQELNDFPPKESEAPPSCEEASSFSEDTSIGRQSALSSLEDEDEKNIRQNIGVSIPPLFVHLICLVRTNHNVGNCSLKSAHLSRGNSFFIRGAWLQY
ncbi:uncharacterized protein LOC143253096 isoform X1 [Tachypleus tridentatus]|uniref:uncharacterized protein LOC143253096 isoform X1 n=1 Tax=Tachypleus tridentatus TaxID=6853 RepID=UPI003FD4CDC2